MIIQRVIKGITGIDDSAADAIFEKGIMSNWWRRIGTLPIDETHERLNARNLYWHQNRYSDPDPLMGGSPFSQNTPFISTTAGSVERDPSLATNTVRPAWLVALEFATDFFTQDGYLFYCYLFVLGRPTVEHLSFSEELRELNVYTGYSPFQPEGEITAKIYIPPTQIEKYEFYKRPSSPPSPPWVLPTPDRVVMNTTNYRPPADLVNFREVLN